MTPSMITFSAARIFGSAPSGGQFVSGCQIDKRLVNFRSKAGRVLLPFPKQNEKA
jgi:hypothetical protein